jgi:Cof subfamily protein (haloacid dehalogenase superfamily)
MDIECCVCDLDGTLLNSDLDLSAETISVIKKLRENGVKVVLATGRNEFYVNDLAHRLGLSTPIISCNGGLVREQIGGEILYSKHLPSPVDRKIIEYCFENDYDFIVSSYDFIYYQKNSERVNFFNRYNSQVQSSFLVPIKVMTQPDDLPLGKLLKVFIWKINEQQINDLKQFDNSDDKLSIILSEKNGLDIMAKGISKGEALRFVAQKYKINLAKTVVFGDNYNDISMMKIVGCPIAVANAERQVKQVAKYVTLSNDEDGVALAIRKYILDKN